MTRRSVGELRSLAQRFCEEMPHRRAPYDSRAWGGPLHSLCSYQGKLKPSIAHFLVSWFTQIGEVVLDPLAGVGTIPLEARRQGRTAIANDLSPLAYVVSSAKLTPIEERDVDRAINRLRGAIAAGPVLRVLEQSTDVGWGLNSPISAYFHPDTLREVLAARVHFRTLGGDRSPADLLVEASVLHILHGNRPYALSRRSHPLTPFAPTGEFEYRRLVERVEARIARVLPELLRLTDEAPVGRSEHGDFRDLSTPTVDALITSPPFTQSFRFWSMNWMRLWFAGWEPADFAFQPTRYLELQQRASFEPYRELLKAAQKSLRPNGLMILHLGETAAQNMATEIEPLLDPDFHHVYSGREDVGDGEHHGFRDKGATRAHWYLFAVRR